MGASEHDRAATEVEALAYEHALRAGQMHKDRDRCEPAASCRPAPGGVPIDDQKQQAQQLLWTAAAHRSAARALRAQEEAACRWVPDRKRALAVFKDPRRMGSVEALRIASSHVPTTRLGGSVIALVAGDDLSKAALERLLACDVGMAAVLGPCAPETLGSPLMVPGARFEVRSAGSGLCVKIRADDRCAAAEILRRAYALIGQVPENTDMFLNQDRWPRPARTTAALGEGTDGVT